MILKDFVNNSYLRHNSIIFKKYQRELVLKAQEIKFSAIVLPTGLGKTTIAKLFFTQNSNRFKRCLFLAPTNILTLQQFLSFKKDLQNIEVIHYTSKKNFSFANRAIFFSTGHLVVLNLSLFRKNIDLILIDEIHNISKDSPYSKIIEFFKDDKNISIVGLTATLEDKPRKILKSLDKNFKIVTTEEPVSLNFSTKYRTIRFLETQELEYLKDQLNIFLKNLTPLDLMQKGFNCLKEPIIIAKPASVLSRSLYFAISKKRFARFRLIRSLITFYHIKELLFSQPLVTLKDYFKKNLKNWNLLDQEPLFKKMIISFLKFKKKKNKKLLVLLHFLRSNRYKKIIVFFKYTTTAIYYYQQLLKRGISVLLLLGQKNTKRPRQKQIIDQFRTKGKILLTTSVAEQGLDIGSINLVLNYDRPKSNKKIIQRAGRTGRFNDGIVIDFISAKTDDDFFYNCEKIPKFLEK